MRVKTSLESSPLGTGDQTAAEIVDASDLQSVNEQDLLAAHMPSVLARLRPMDATSEGIRRYFIDRDAMPRPIDAPRRVRS